MVKVHFTMVMKVIIVIMIMRIIMKIMNSSSYLRVLSIITQNRILPSASTVVIQLLVQKQSPRGAL